MIPDQWIKEQEVTEECGWMPLDEVTRVNKVGQVYDVTFIFRGGTSRVKFFWPEAKRPSKSDMQAAVEKLYPKGRLVTYYPCMSGNENNFMVMVPPMTEDYEVIPEDTWIEMSEELNEVYHQICEEVGEPITFPMDNDDENIVLYVEDHDTGEEQEVIIEGGLHAWFSKSKSKDGKAGWVQSDGSTCARKPGQTSAPKCYSSQRLAALKRTPEGKKKIRSADARKKSQDSGQSSKTGAAKPTMVKTFTDPKDKKRYKSGDQTLKDESFDPTIDEACWAGYTQKGMKTMFGKQYPNCVKKTAKKTKKEEVEFTTEDVVSDLEEILLELDDTSWQSIDKAMRELCREHNITPKELHKQFKAEHGMIPDDWIKEQEVTEDCGWFPLDEMTRINKVGQVYDVTFIFRGGTSRFKFFWPTMTRPSKKEMQAAVEKFYPRARLIAYYPCMKSNDDNMMIIVPPMTENYEIIPELSLIHI